MKELITIAAEEFIDKWNANHKKQVPYIENKFDLTGKCAGQLKWRGDKYWFRWNLQLAKENQDDYLVNTVGHEVAHLIVEKIYLHASSHGKEWKSVMRSLGLTPERCHNYSVTPAKTFKRPYKYNCPCGATHHYTIRKFKNIIQAGISSTGQTNYHCGYCHTPINITKVKPS